MKEKEQLPHLLLSPVSKAAVLDDSQPVFVADNACRLSGVQ